MEVNIIFNQKLLDMIIELKDTWIDQQEVRSIEEKADYLSDKVIDLIKMYNPNIENLNNVPNSMCRSLLAIISIHDISPNCPESVHN